MTEYTKTEVEELASTGDRLLFPTEAQARQAARAIGRWIEEGSLSVYQKGDEWAVGVSRHVVLREAMEE